LVQSAGKAFPKGEWTVIREGEAGWGEMVGCVLLEVVEETTDDGRKTTKKQPARSGDRPEPAEKGGEDA